MVFLLDMATCHPLVGYNRKTVRKPPGKKLDQAGGNQLNVGTNRNIRQVLEVRGKMTRRLASTSILSIVFRELLTLPKNFSQAVLVWEVILEKS